MWSTRFTSIFDSKAKVYSRTVAMGPNEKVLCKGYDCREKQILARPFGI